jgi:hypothetical protein
MDHAPDISLIAVTNGRAPHRRFGIRQPDRLHHLYLIGETGTGKSTLLESLVLQDVEALRSVVLIDPHGDLAERLHTLISDHHAERLTYLDAADLNQPYGYNPLRRVRVDKIPLAASGLLEAFKMLFKDAWGVRMEHVFRNTLYALLEYGKATLPDILRMLVDRPFRRIVLTHVNNHQVRAFWTQEYPKYNPRYRQEAIAPIQNKVGAFLADPRLHHLFTSAPVDLHIRQHMDTGRILIINLAKGRLGEDSANLLGALLVTTVSLAAFSRAETPPQGRRPAYVYIDEFQNFTTLSVATMISELRKYRVGLTFAHQHLDQLEEDVRHAVLGNAGTIISFRLGPEDARVMARVFDPVFGAEDLLGLPNHDICLRLMIDGTPSRPFSGTTLTPRTVSAIGHSGL